MCILSQVWSYFMINRKWKFYLKNKELSKAGVSPVDKDYTFLLKPCVLAKRFYQNQKKKHKMKIKKVTTGGTFENFVFMAIVGLVVGIALSFIYFYFEFYMGEATIFFSFLVRLPLTIAFTLYIAFKQEGRSLVLLAPLQLFSTWGQQFMKGEVVMLVMEGPLVNLKHNVDIIKESNACQQRGAMAAAAEVADILFGPFASFQQAAMELVKGIKAMVDKLQSILNAFKRTVMAVADAIQDATRWINSKINGCKNTVGTTYKHCMDAFTWMYDECKVSVPSIFVPMCSVTEFASNLCSSVKPGEYLCDLVYFNIDPLVTTISQRISRLMDRAYTLMHFEVNIHHEYSMDSNSKSISEELMDRLKGVFDSALFMSLGLGFYGIVRFLLTFLFIWHIWMYRKRYLARDDFDNYYITEKLRSIDVLESLKGNETIFPLRRVEKRKYVKWNSIYLIRKEYKEFAFPTITIFVTGFVGLVVGLDHILYYVVDKCRLFMLAMMQSAGVRTEVNVEGNGFIAELSRRVVRSLNYMDYDFYYTHFMPCVPNPKKPNSLNNKKIFFFLALLWISWVMRPYSMRLRHLIMDYYHPQNYFRRARWLHNSIIFKRVTFISLISVKLRGKHGRKGKDLSLADILRARFPMLTIIIGKGLLGEECLICAHMKPPLYRCTTTDCLGIFCDDCYTNIKGVCSICKDRMRHPDFENVDFGTVQQNEMSKVDDKGFFQVYNVEDGEDLEFSYQDGISNPSNTPEMEEYLKKYIMELKGEGLGNGDVAVDVDGSEATQVDFTQKRKEPIASEYVAVYHDHFQKVHRNKVGYTRLHETSPFKNNPVTYPMDYDYKSGEQMYSESDTPIKVTRNKEGYTRLQESSSKKKLFSYSKLRGSYKRKDTLLEHEDGFKMQSRFGYEQMESPINEHFLNSSEEEKFEMY